MANRMVSYRIAAEFERGKSRFRRPVRLTVTQISERVLQAVVQVQLGPNPYLLDSMTDYSLAAQAGVSVRQTSELYEEIGLGIIVRSALDKLRDEDLIVVESLAPRGPYKGFRASPGGIASVDVRPWYLRALSFFDPPANKHSGESSASG